MGEIILCDDFGNNIKEIKVNKFKMNVWKNGADINDLYSVFIEFEEDLKKIRNILNKIDDCLEKDEKVILVGKIENGNQLKVTGVINPKI